MGGEEMSKLIRRMAAILESGYEHSHDREVWGHHSEPENHQAFYYAYSHLSYVCACMLANETGEAVDAETFINLLEHPPSDGDWESAVKITLA